MHWCVIEEATGKIIMNGSCGADATAADFALSGGTPLLNIPAHVTHEKHYYLGGTFHEFGASPGEFYAWDWVTHAWALPATALDAARAKQAAIISAACQSTIYEGYASAALGSARHYPATAQDQVDLVASVVASLLPNLPQGWTTPLWCELGGVWTLEEHTAAQTQTAFADAVDMINTQIGVSRVLKEEIAAAATIEDVQEIVWTN